MEVSMLELTQQLYNLFEKFQTVSSEYTDYKDILFDDINTELAEDSFKTLRLLNNGRKIWSITRFKLFIKGLNLNSNEESIQKLINYVDNKDKAEFIISTFEKILLSNSKLACCVMGIMLNDICNTNKNISQENLVILQALSMMNDFDIKNFTHLMSISPWGKNQKSKTIKISDIQGCVNKYNDTAQGIELTINLLEKYGLIKSNGEIDLNMDSDDVDLSSAEYDKYYEFNTLSQTLYEYTNKVVTI